MARRAPSQNSAYSSLPPTSSSSSYFAHAQIYAQPHEPSFPVLSLLQPSSPVIQTGRLQYSSSLPPSTSTSRFLQGWDANKRGSSILLDDRLHSHHRDPHRLEPTLSARTKFNTMANMQRSASVASYNTGDDAAMLNRNTTLKKKGSIRRNGTLRRSSSRRSMKAGSVRSLAVHSTSDPEDALSAFYCPIPTSGNPTDVLATRFQTWRKVLKDLIAYFREIQSHYEQRSKSLVKLFNTSTSVQMPSGFLTSGGIDDALQILRNHHKTSLQDAGKSKEVEEEVILALTGLRSDLQQKIKEIKNLSGDFKNSVEKEMDGTAKAVRILQDALGKNEMDSSSTVGRQDPYLLRLAVDRQVERQIDEENYLHQAYLNLESSGRELEAIVVGEIQKAYNAYANILKREAEHSLSVVDELRGGPISMLKDQEWLHFVADGGQFVDPEIPIRAAEFIHYPGQTHVSAQEIRAGLLERKSKYLKSYTAGWYVLSTTHLHEFKSADKTQAPVMSLYLPEQKLGSHSTEGGSSNKFILKGRQTGAMHRGHTWVFRAESHDTMMAWYEDIKALTEKSPEERNQFVRSHSRSISRSLSQSSRRSMDSDRVLDEDDDEPFAAGSQIQVDTTASQPRPELVSRRSQQGGRFPSEIQLSAQRGLPATISSSSMSSAERQDLKEGAVDGESVVGQNDVPALAAAVVATDGAVTDFRGNAYGTAEGRSMNDIHSQAMEAVEEAQHDGVNPYTSTPLKKPSTRQPSPPAKYSHQKSGKQSEALLNAAVITSNSDGSTKEVEAKDLKDPEHSPARSSADFGTSNNHGSLNGLAKSAFVQPKLVPEWAAEPRTVSMLSGEKTRSEAGTEADRPTQQNARHDSRNTISNLHVPGGFPRGSVAGP